MVSWFIPPPLCFSRTFRLSAFSHSRSSARESSFRPKLTDFSQTWRVYGEVVKVSEDWFSFRIIRFVEFGSFLVPFLSFFFCHICLLYSRYGVSDSSATGGTCTTQSQRKKKALISAIFSRMQLFFTVYPKTWYWSWTCESMNWNLQGPVKTSRCGLNCTDEIKFSLKAIYSSSSSCFLPSERKQ